jgi:hypothetical protein
MLVTFIYFEKKKNVSKAWPNDSRVDCKAPFNLVRFIEMNVKLEKKLEEFDDEFERQEIMNTWMFRKKAWIFHFSYLLGNIID